MPLQQDGMFLVLALAWGWSVLPLPEFTETPVACLGPCWISGIPSVLRQAMPEHHIL